MNVSKETLAMTLERHLAKHLDCFGAFDMSDPVCRKHCALCLRCIIEKNRHFQMEFMEDITTGELIPVRLN